MVEWEYITIEIKSQGTQKDRWFIVTKEKTTIHGMDNILNTLRQRGWELISLVPTSFSIGFLTPEATGLMAVFKRPLTGQ